MSLSAPHMRERVGDEGGFTLIEMLVAISIGMVVLIAVTTLLDSGGRASARLTDKTETVQRTRIAMDRIVRILRTQVCADTSTPPLMSGTGDSVTFYSDTGTGATFQPRKVTLSYSSAGTGSVTQQIWDSTTTSPPWTYPTAPTSTRVLIDNVAPTGSSFLSYYSFADLTNRVSAPLDTSLSADPLPVNSVAKIVKIDVGIQGRPTTGNTDAARRTALSTSVYTRNADFSTAAAAGRTQGPRCG